LIVQLIIRGLKIKGVSLSALLHIEVSPWAENSLSRSVSTEFVTSWNASHAEGTVITRDLDKTPIPHLDVEAISAGFMAETDRSEPMAAKWGARMYLIEEISGADEILISTPMWNWSVPSVLKAYIDNVIIPGVFDESTATLAGKKVTFVVAQGGSYVDGTPKAGWDYASGYLRQFATAMGATDIEVITVEFGLAGVVPALESFISHKEASIAAAKQAAATRATG
jgi:FMN-dependent NADH-azoreductase